MSNITKHTQQSSLGARVTLFKLDLSLFNLQTLYFVNGYKGAQAVQFDGNTYNPLPIIADGFETVSEGVLPRPRLSVSNVSGIFTPLIVDNDNLLGAELTRIRTYEKFLDNGSDPDPTATLPLDVYVLNRRMPSEERDVIIWELVAALDQEGSKLPGRQVVRDYCDHIYRTYDPSIGDFDYTNVTCPYVGNQFFNLSDELVVKPEEDLCAKRLSSCRLRFGKNNELPYHGFPAVAKLKTR